ncbi:hypothetical protein KCP69_15435 [Salmonella enterica subsp. enterica]|nr:hypothetical protein KCP69_15435 [Salmonella enterica subsp. enterica]
MDRMVFAQRRSGWLVYRAGLYHRRTVKGLIWKVLEDDKALLPAGAAHARGAQRGAEANPALMTPSSTLFRPFH